MRFFALLCFCAAGFYIFTAAEAMFTGKTSALRGDTESVIENKGDSGFGRIVAARWLAGAGFGLLGGVLLYFGPRLDAMAQPPAK